MTQLTLMKAFQVCCVDEFKRLVRPTKAVQALIHQGLVKIGKSGGPHLRLTKKGEKLRDLLARYGLTGWYSKGARELEMLVAAELLVGLAESEKEIASCLDSANSAKGSR